jgi:hypothetical protein
LYTQDRGQRQANQNNKTQHRKLKRWARQTPPKPGVNPGAHEVSAVPLSYKTSTVLLI